MKDIHNNMKVTSTIPPAAILAGNATLTGTVIDTQGFDSNEFVILTGAITDSVITPTVYEDDAVGMGTEAAVADADLLPRTGAETDALVESGDDSVAFKIGYTGNKRYIRIKLVQTGATTGGYVAAACIQMGARNAPVS